MPDRSGRIIHTGQAIVDLALEIDHLPAPGGDTFARRWSLHAGGGFNLMAAARREGAPVLYTGGHGTGPFGDLVRDAMATEGVQVLAPVTTDMDTGFCVALVDDNAERTFVSTLGAEGAANRCALEAAEATSSDVVHVSGYSLYHDTNGRLLAQWLPTLEEGVQVVIDPSPMLSEIPPEILSTTLDVATL